MPPGTDRIQALLTEHLRGRYQVDREIGRGGMAHIFLARSPERQEPLAIKVMSPKVAEVLGAERFRREIALAGRLQHPLIVPLWDSGEAGDLLFYVMPYVEGETLHDRIRREHQLPLADALAITRDVASALRYAHERGVLHRDIKPENVLLTGSRALLADFGLARAIGGEYTRLTRTGTIVGTIHYMSPEQLREDPDLDLRADVYSLGCILYEMLAGTPPYVAPSLRELVRRCLTAPIPSVRLLRPDIPREIDAAIAATLAKSRDDRSPSMEAFLAALAAGLPA